MARKVVPPTKSVELDLRGKTFPHHNHLKYEPDESGQVVRKVDIKGTGLRYQIGLLLSCHWCVGIWSSLAIVALYSSYPVTFPVFLILAIAGAAAFIESKLYFG